MPQINVALLNGHAELLTFLPSSTVQDVRIKAQRALGQKCLRLVTSKKRVLVDFEQTLEEAEIEDGECLTALVLQPQLAATSGCLCLVVSWRQHNCYLGFCRPWWWQFGSSRSAEGAANSGHYWRGFCCYSGRWIRRDLGWWKGWRWQLDSSRSAEGCAADSGHKSCICCDSGRWIRGDLGWCKGWRWQFGSSRSAQGCAADSIDRFGLCCDSGRWIRGDLGWCMGWRWQFGSSRSAQGRAADSSHKVGLCCDSGRWIHRDLGSWRGGW